MRDSAGVFTSAGRSGRCFINNPDATRREGGQGGGQGDNDKCTDAALFCTNTPSQNPARRRCRQDPAMQSEECAGSRRPLPAPRGTAPSLPCCCGNTVVHGGFVLRNSLLLMMGLKSALSQEPRFQTSQLPWTEEDSRCLKHCPFQQTSRLPRAKDKQESPTQTGRGGDPNSACRGPPWGKQVERPRQPVRP